MINPVAEIRKKALFSSLDLLMVLRINNAGKYEEL